MRSAKLRECSTCPETSAPSRLPLAICSESLLRSAFNSSASRMARRRSASRSTTCFTSSAPPLPTSARSTASGWSRISRRSSTALQRFDGRGALGLDASDGADAVVGLEVDDPHTPGVAPLGGDVGGMEADHLAIGRDDQDVVAVVHLEHGDDGAVAAAGLDVDDALAGPPLQPVLVEGRPLAEIAHRHARRDHLAFAEREEVHHGLALGLAPALGNLVDLQPVDLAAVREEEEVRVCRGDEEVLDDVLLLRLHAGHAFAPALLAA